ncbi:MAG: efflux transporter periplasmic adaptor subunit [Halobacteriovoraceae bacterium]|nr:efflux transporter periplasmic adaptor subunit [Halobacteriovoraceae bacterium]|tara:strand:- start:124463 stop:125812 length:1350 start_codon:yes stop_codon:yes gene_type:complete
MKVFLLLFLLAPVFQSCLNTQDGHAEKKETHEKHEVFYTCPMHPQVRENKSGKCPICHMNLVKVEIDQGQAISTKAQKKMWQCEKFPDVTSEVKEVCPLDGTPMVPMTNRPGEVIGEVRIREAQKKHFKPAYFTVTPMKMSKVVRLLGTALPSEKKESNIPARVPGRVEKVYVESTGSHIKEGAPVIDLYSPELITGGEEYLLARKNDQKRPNAAFKDLLKQSEERLRLWGIKKWQMEKWYKSGKVPRSITLYSPTTGVVQKLNAVVGKYFKEGENFFELSELSSLWVEMDVYEHDSALVELGQSVDLEFTALPGKRISGNIDFISPVLNPKSRTLKVRTTVGNPDGELRPGMVADAALKVEFDGTPLVVPRSAIIDTGKRKVVWTKVDEKTFQARKVLTGHESQGYVEVVEGLKEGDEVVIEANFLLDAQAQLFGGYEDFERSSTHQH